MKRQLITALLVPITAALFALAACEKKAADPVKPAGKSAPTSTTKHDDHDHAPGDKHDHDHDEHAAGHGGKVIELGAATIEGFVLKATRDEGKIVPGKDAPIDVSITPAPGATKKAAGVRFWIGAQDAKGTIKAKAEVEDPKDPARWHTHAEIPDPLPAGSKLWVEIETDKGEKVLASFDLKS